MLNLKKKTHLSVELNDYVIRGLVKKGSTIETWEIIEMALPNGIISDGTIADEMGLYELLKENATKFGGKNQNVRIFVPDTSVLLKSFDHPTDVKGDKLKEYVQMELGRTIHLPFQEPLVDVYDHNEEDGHAVLFAVPPEEVGKFVGIMQDLNFYPEVADIRALSNLRLLETLNIINDSKTYLIADWSINELSISIYTNGNVEFLRFQSIETDLNKWHAVVEGNEVKFELQGDMQEYLIRITDQVLELDRILNFFKFSLHKGEKTVDELLMMGDNPLLANIAQMVEENISTPITIIDDEVIQAEYPNFKAKHASLLGLAFKEVKV